MLNKNVTFFTWRIDEIHCFRNTFIFRIHQIFAIIYNLVNLNTNFVIVASVALYFLYINILLNCRHFTLAIQPRRCEN